MLNYFPPFSFEGTAMFARRNNFRTLFFMLVILGDVALPTTLKPRAGYFRFLIYILDTPGFLEFRQTARRPTKRAGLVAGHPIVDACFAEKMLAWQLFRVLYNSVTKKGK